MAGRPIAAVPNIFTTEGTGSLNNIPLLDADFSFLNSQNNDSAIGYVNYAVDTGVANTYVVTLTSPPSGYVAGMTIAVNILNSNTGPSTINVSALGSVSILMANGGALVGGELTAGQMITFIFDGTSFRLQDAYQALSVNLGAFSTNQVVNCAGISSVFVTGTTGTSGLNVTLQMVGIAVPIFMTIGNSSGGSIALGVQATNFRGTSIGVTGILTSTGASFSLSSGGVTFNAGQTHAFSGSGLSTGIVLIVTG